MKTVILLAAVLIFSSCATPDGGWTLDPTQYLLNERQRHRAIYVAAHPEMREDFKQRIASAYPEPMMGMSMDQVQACKGSPQRRTSTTSGAGRCAAWYYGRVLRYGGLQYYSGFIFVNGRLVRKITY